MTRPRRTERTWGNVAALCAKPAEVCAFGRFTSRSSHRCYSRRARRNREIIFAAPSRGRAREGTTHTLENVRICERKERRITYVVKKMCLERTRGIIIQFRDFPTFALRSQTTCEQLTQDAPGRPTSHPTRLETRELANVCERIANAKENRETPPRRARLPCHSFRQHVEHAATVAEFLAKGAALDERLGNPLERVLVEVRVA